MKQVLLTFILSFAASFALQAQQANSLLWKIESPDAEEASYLFGTYHLVGSGYLESHQKVKKAYNEASTVVVEMLTDSSKLMQVAMIGMMPGTTLSQLMDSADYALLKKEMKEKMGMDMALLNNMKPMVISSMYAVTVAQEATPEDFRFEGQPIDHFFAVDAKKEGKEVVALETMMEQAHMLLDSIPLEKQAEALAEMLHEGEGGAAMTEDVLETYRNEDLDAMLALADSAGGFLTESGLFLSDRNKRWVDTLVPLLKKGGVFIAVGALHLPGEEGLIELLRAEGFKLSPVK